MKKLGIDVSAWQGRINWSAVKADGITFAILKAGGSDDGVYTDGWYEYNYAECKRLGIPVGAYWFVGGGCTSVKDGEADAIQFEKRLAGKQFELPVYMDLETPPLKSAYRAGNTNAAIAFCRYLEKKGYYAGVYGSTYSTFQSIVEDDRLTPFAHWCAQYASGCSYWNTYGIWQFTSGLRVNGIDGRVDGNYLYIDYEAIIKKLGRNGYKAQEAAKDTAGSSTKEQPKKPAKLTVNGKWNVATTKRLQEELGQKADGEIWNQQTKCKPYLEACLSTSWKFNDEAKDGSPTIKALQKLIGAKVDGFAGVQTVERLQVFLNKTINADLKVDGKCGYYTVCALQTWLNK